MRLDDPVERGILVAAGQEEPSVAEVREPAAEDVEAGIDVDGRLRAGRGIPHRRPRVVVDRVGLRGVVADGVVGQDLAVGQQRDVHADHGPVDDGTPLALVLRGPGQRSRRGARILGRELPGVGVERALLRGAVDDGVLGGMAVGGLDALMGRGRRRGRRSGREQDREDERGAASRHGSTLCR
jgi:hypothetical protein